MHSLLIAALKQLLQLFLFLQITLMWYIFKLMTHPMHSGLLMKSIVAFCTITGHICQRLAYTQICFHMVFWSEWLSGSSLFIRG